MDEIRSFGFRFSTSATNTKIVRKDYYELGNHFQIPTGFVLPNDAHLRPFEYALTNGMMDAINFHVNLVDGFDRRLRYPSFLTSCRDVIKNLFGEDFRNYTIGYRFFNNNLCGYSYYYYPTVMKGDRVGIRGITGYERLFNIKQAFIKIAAILNLKSIGILNQYLSIITKFKGISVTTDSLGIIGYKIYGKASTEDMLTLVRDIIHLDTGILETYGDICLCALRFNLTEFNGFNVYYLPSKVSV